MMSYADTSSVFPPRNSVLLIGPRPSHHSLGGVNQHMSNLLRLQLFKEAFVFDPGSTGGSLNLHVLSIICKLFQLRKIVIRIRPRYIWINNSIYTGSFLKLLLIVLSLRGIEGSDLRVFFHGGRFENLKFLKLRALWLASKTLLEKVSKFHFLSAEQAHGFAEVFPQLHWERFSNYLPVETRLPRNTHPRRVFLFAGRLVEEKGIYVCLEAFRILLEKNSEDILLWFAGDGPEIHHLRMKASELPNHSVRVWGALDARALEDLYSQAFVLLLPSWREGLPYVVLEAMRAGLPIIATPTGALPDIIQDGVNGFFVPYGDPKALAGKIEILLNNPLLAEAMRDRNLMFFESNFSRRAMEKFYLRLLLPKVSGAEDLVQH